MNSVKRLNELADKFAMKISRAQTTGAQSGDIETALKSAGQWISSDQIAPLLGAAKVPDTASLNISIMVDNKLHVKFLVSANPDGAYSKALASLLEQKFSPNMSMALKKANIQVANTITAGLATFA